VRARALALQTIVDDGYGGRSDDRMLRCRAMMVMMMMVVVREQTYAHSFTYG
jgi:hypothetical protein